jgi:hypothetical protein
MSNIVWNKCLQGKFGTLINTNIVLYTIMWDMSETNSHVSLFRKDEKAAISTFSCNSYIQLDIYIYELMRIAEIDYKSKIRKDKINTIV